MRMGYFSLPVLLLSGLSISSAADSEKSANYCYKPDKPLWFSTYNYKKRYKEDVEEYQRCVKHFNQVHENIAKMQAESDKNTQNLLSEFDRSQSLLPNQ